MELSTLEAHRREFRHDGAISQIFAVRHPMRLRTLTLTNCGAHDNLPPAGFTLGKRLAREHQLAPLIMEFAKSTELARGNPGMAMGYKRPEDLSDEIVEAFLGVFADPERAHSSSASSIRRRSRICSPSSPAWQ